MINEIVIKKFEHPQDYKSFEEIHLDLHDQVVSQNLSGYIVFLQYDEVFTCGRFTKDKNYKDISIVKSSRGGDVTFHGNGQEIIYPIINIKKLDIKLRDYVDILHNFLIKFLKSKGINSSRYPKKPGLWVKNKKVSSMGIAIKKGVTLHGLSLNIKCDLNSFSLIEPCGDSSIQVGNLLELSNTNQNSMRLELANSFLKELSSYTS